MEDIILTKDIATFNPTTEDGYSLDDMIMQLNNIRNIVGGDAKVLLYDTDMHTYTAAEHIAITRNYHKGEKETLFYTVCFDL